MAKTDSSHRRDASAVREQDLSGSLGNNSTYAICNNSQQNVEK